MVQLCLVIAFTGLAHATPGRYGHPNDRAVAIGGAGPSGAALALALARRGLHVHVFESRTDAYQASTIISLLKSGAHTLAAMNIWDLFEPHIYRFDPNFEPDASLALLDPSQVSQYFRMPRGKSEKMRRAGLFVLENLVSSLRRELINEQNISFHQGVSVDSMALNLKTAPDYRSYATGVTLSLFDNKTKSLHQAVFDRFVDATGYKARNWSPLPGTPSPPEFPQMAVINKDATGSVPIEFTPMTAGLLVAEMSATKKLETTFHPIRDRERSFATLLAVPGSATILSSSDPSIEQTLIGDGKQPSKDELINALSMNNPFQKLIERYQLKVTNVSRTSETLMWRHPLPITALPASDDDQLTSLRYTSGRYFCLGSQQFGVTLGWGLMESIRLAGAFTKALLDGIVRDVISEPNDLLTLQSRQRAYVENNGQKPTDNESRALNIIANTLNNTSYTAWMAAISNLIPRYVHSARKDMNLQTLRAAMIQETGYINAIQSNMIGASELAARLDASNQEFPLLGLEIYGNQPPELSGVEAFSSREDILPLIRFYDEIKSK